MAIAFVSADLDFSNRIVRITDAATNPNFPNTGYETRSSGHGDENIFNYYADPKVLKLLRSLGPFATVAVIEAVNLMAFMRDLVPEARA